LSLIEILYIFTIGSPTLHQCRGGVM